MGGRYPGGSSFSVAEGGAAEDTPRHFRSMGVLAVFAGDPSSRNPERILLDLRYTFWVRLEGATRRVRDCGEMFQTARGHPGGFFCGDSHRTRWYPSKAGAVRHAGVLDSSYRFARRRLSLRGRYGAVRAPFRCNCSRSTRDLMWTILTYRRRQHYAGWSFAEVWLRSRPFGDTRYGHCVLDGAGGAQV